MANPVMNSIVKDWSTQSTTPAGYPEMPGYQPVRHPAGCRLFGAAGLRHCAGWHRGLPGVVRL